VQQSKVGGSFAKIKCGCSDASQLQQPGEPRPPPPRLPPGMSPGIRAAPALNRCRCIAMTCACHAVLCLCKCMIVRALRRVRAVLCMLCGRAFALLCLRFTSTRPESPFASRVLLPLSCTLFFLFFYFLLVCMHPFVMLLSCTCLDSIQP
jgi:hypothetical protein